MKPLGAFKVDSAFYDIEVNQMSTNNSRRLSGKNILRQQTIKNIKIYTGLLSSSASLNPWGVASLALVDNPSSDGVTIKIPYRLDILLHQPALDRKTPCFPIGLVKTESDFIVRSVETGLGR